jgi:hypothetical protein
VEYQQAAERYIGSMYKANFQWKSAHVVEIWEVYLQNGHCYTFQASVYSGEVDLGMSLVGRSGSGPYYTNRSAAVFNIDSYGSGISETTSWTISSGDGWYALVLWSNNGRNGMMDVSVKEQFNPGTTVAINEQNGVWADKGHFYCTLNSSTTMGAIGMRPNDSNDYNLYLYSSSSYNYHGGSSLISSTYMGDNVDFILYNKAAITTNTYYPLVNPFDLTFGISGYILDADDTDETLALGTNGPFGFATNSAVKAWDVALTTAVEYQFTVDITSGTPDLGMALYRKDATYKSQFDYLFWANSGEAGVDEASSWVCDATTSYALVVWNNGGTGDYNILITSYPNLDAYVASGWSYEFVPRNTAGASFSNCPITLSLPGNTANTRLNWITRNHSANAISGLTFYSQLYLDDSLFFSYPNDYGLEGNEEYHYTDWITATPIRGGKHTIELREDGTNAIMESNESDNSYFRQFVWSPLVLVNNTPVERTAPPMWSAMFPRPNCDGFQFTRTPNYAYAVGICPRGSTDDYDLEGCDDYMGSLSGFDSLRVSSYMQGWDTDYFIATYTGTADTIYPEVYAFSGGTGNYVIEAVDASDRQLSVYGNPTRRDTLGTDHILKVYEVYLWEDSTYRIILDNISGGAALDLTMYGPDYGYYSCYNYTAASWSGYSDEIIDFHVDWCGYYVITVHKTGYGALPLTNIYDITVENIPPNLVKTVPSGWSYEFVPRNVGGASSSNCSIAATLPGNSNDTFLNFCAKNDGVRSVPVTAFYNQLYLDGDSTVFYQRPWEGGIVPGGTIYHLNRICGTEIQGGRHTVELRLDGTNTIYETNEGDNSVSRQFVWSPYELPNGVPEVRNTPPPRGSLPYPNCDGFQYTRNPQYAYGIAICPMLDEANDLYIYSDYTGSEAGFSSLLASSYWGSGYTSFIVATYWGTSDVVYPGVFYSWGNPTGNTVVEAIDDYGKLFYPIGTTFTDSLLANELLDVYEVYMDSGTSYSITTTALSGTADIALALYGPDWGYYERSDHVAYSDRYMSSHENIAYTPTVGGWYVVVVFKGTNDQLANSLIYQIKAMVATTNLTYGTPTGWSYPIVPRNTWGATPGNCILTATLPGNTYNTFWNLSSYNQGPDTITTRYYDYLFIDSVLFYGIWEWPPIAPGTFGMCQNMFAWETIRGGRHTLGIHIDHNDSIPESNENDNWYQRQFVWSPYVLTNNTPVTRDEPPSYGSEAYPNCDGFEFNSGRWGAVGIIPIIATSNFNIRLYSPWWNSEIGFDDWWAFSGEGIGITDFVLMNCIYGGSSTYDVGVVQNYNNNGTGQFVIQQANEQATYYTPGTYGPFTLPSNQVMGLWEVFLSTPGTYNFQVDVTSGGADIGTSLYDGNALYNAKLGYFTGGFSNSEGGGGDESFSIVNPYSGMYFGWAVWKVGSADRTLTSTFNLVWNSSAARIPMPVEDLVIEQIGGTDVRLTWSPVTQDTSGSAITVNYYRIYRNLNPDFTPSSSDSIGYTPGNTTIFIDPDVTWTNQEYFYRVIAVASGGPTYDIVTSQPPATDTPAVLRSRHRQ